MNTEEKLTKVWQEIEDIADKEVYSHELYEDLLEASKAVGKARSTAHRVLTMGQPDKYGKTIGVQSGYDRNRNNLNTVLSRKSIKSATDEELKYMRKNYPQSINESDYQKVVDKLNSLPECNECNFFYYEEPDGSYTIADKNETLDISEYDYTTRTIRKTLMDMGYFLEPVHTFQDFTLGLM